MPVLHIQLLGHFRLAYGDEPLTAVVHVRQALPGPERFLQTDTQVVQRRPYA